MSIKEFLLDVVFMTSGCLIYSTSVSIFTAPNKIVAGGLTGVATLLHYTVGTPIGVMYLILNIPLFLIAFRKIGGEFIIKSTICALLTSIGVQLLSFLPRYSGGNGNMFLVAIYGGILEGIGMALVFLRGSTTGGTDIASRILKLRWPFVPMGRMMMIIDAFIILISIAVFKSVNNGLYAIIEIFVSSRVIDAILYGSDNGKMAVVISDKNEDIAQTINSEIGRGVTMLKGSGFYTGRERDVLLCAVRRQQTSQIRSIVHKQDSSAFVIMCEASDVMGEGFKPIDKEL